MKCTNCGNEVSEQAQFCGASGYLVDSRGQIEATAMEIDRIYEILFIAKTASGVLHPLDLRVDGFAARIGDAMS